jgi:protein SCO1/2
MSGGDLTIPTERLLFPRPLVFALPSIRETAFMKPPLRIGLVLLGAILLVALGGCGRKPYSYHGEVVEPPAPAADFTLTGPDGKTVSLSDFRGKVVALYFGYTFCPDVCPTTMAALAQAMRDLGAKADDVQVVMVTVDPERDTPDKLNTYVTAFDPRFIGLSGTPDEIARAAQPFGVVYKKHAGSSATNYLVDHTASTTVIDRDGRVRLIWPYGTPSDELAADLDHLLQ